MATQNNWGEFVASLVNWLPNEIWRLKDPVWLLLAVLPFLMLLTRLQRNPLKELNFKNDRVHDSSVSGNQRYWPRRCIDIIMFASMLLLVYPAARPINSTAQMQQRSLIIWVYDASTSMSTLDVKQDGRSVSRLEASVSALEESLTDIPAEFHKLLISFASSEDVYVNLPTLSNTELIKQAHQIPRGEYTATDHGLKQAVDSCQQFFNSKDTYPCMIFLLSDGECNPRPQCRLQSNQIAKAAAEKGIVIHTVSWGDSRSDYRPNPVDMQEIADISQGQHLVSSQTQELASLYQDTVSQIEVQQLDYALTEGLVWSARGLIVALALAFGLRRFD